MQAQANDNDKEGVPMSTQIKDVVQVITPPPVIQIQTLALQVVHQTPLPKALTATGSFRSRHYIKFK